MKIFDTPWIRGYRLSYSQHVHTVFGRQLGDSYCFGIQAAWIRAGYQLDTLGVAIGSAGRNEFCRIYEFLQLCDKIFAVKCNS
jgi:hypothetical protein